MPYKKILFVLVIIVIIISVFFNKTRIKNLIQKPAPIASVTSVQPKDDSLKVIGTKPSPLEGVTILPTDSLEITLSKKVNVAEFKHHFDPPIDNTVEELAGSTNNHATYRIKFKKPLELGAGYTLYIESQTHTQEKQNIDHEYIYHFSTIGYSGV